MKKLILLIALIASGISLFAQNQATLTTKDGHKYQGIFITGDNSSVSIRITNDADNIKQQFGTDTINIDMSDIALLYMNGNEYIPYNGTLRVKQSVKREIDYRQQNAFPNIMFGKALKKSGAVGLGIGVPCLATGLVFISVGKTVEVLDNSEKAEHIRRISEAGGYLMPIGASMTLIGIPLYVHGQKIVEMNFNYTGNGVGVSMQF